MSDIIQNRTPQLVTCRITDPSWAFVTSVASPVITFVINNGTEINIPAENLTYSSSLDCFKLIIPASAISSSGTYACSIQDPNIETCLLDGNVWRAWVFS